MIYRLNSIPFIKRATIATLSLMLWLGMLAALGQTQSPNEVRELPPNQTLEREMACAETYRYKSDLKANEFFQMRVEQKGIDIALNLMEASGNVLATMDSPNGKEGCETLSFVAGKAGSFIFEVRGINARGEKGIYILDHEASRESTEKDRRHVAVEKLFYEGMTALDAKGQGEIAIEKLGEGLASWREIEDDYLVQLTAQQDKQLKKLQATAIFDEAFALFQQGTAESYRAARSNFLRARKIYQEIGAKDDEIKSLMGAGFISDNLSEKQAALEYYDQALSMIKSISNNDWKAVILNNIGTVYLAVGERQKSLDYFNQSLSLSRLVKNKSTEASNLNHIGLIYLFSGKMNEALAYFNLSLSLFRSANKKREVAITLSNIGSVYYDLGEKQKALGQFNQSLSLLRQVGDSSGEALMLNNIGLVENDLGEKQKAIDHYEQSYLLFRQVGNEWGVAVTLTNIGTVYWALGDLNKALGYYEQSLPLGRAASNKNGKTQSLVGTGTLRADQSSLECYRQTLFYSQAEMTKDWEAATVNNMGLIYDGLGNKQKAIKYYEGSLALFRESGKIRGVATLLNNLGFNYLLLGDKQKASDYFNQSLLLFRDVGDKSGESAVLDSFGLLYLFWGESERALEYFQRSLLLKKVVGDKPGEAFTLSWIGFYWEKLKSPRLAIFYGKQAVTIYQELRQNIKGLNQEVQKTYLKLIEPAYRKLADLLIEQGSFAQAEQVLAMLKEEEYFNFVRRDSNEIKNLSQRISLNDKEQKLIARYALLADRITEIGQRFLKLGEKKRKLPEGASLSADEQKLYEEFSAQLTTANAAFKLFLEKELVMELGKEAAKEIEVDRNLQAKLSKWGEGTVALRTVVTEDRYRVILTTPAVQVDGKTEIKAADLNKKVFAFRDALQDPSSDPLPLGKELYDILLKPIEKELQAAGAKTLVWSLDGTLRYIPLAALSPDGKSYLVEKYQNVIITPKTRDDISDFNAEWQALGVGVSDSQSVANPDKPEEKLTFKPLPGAKEELLAIVRDEKTPNEKGVLTGKRYLDKDFTITNFTDSLTKETPDGKRKYTVIHIASHFHLGSNWSNSFLLLGNGQVLTLEQVSNSPEITFGDVELITLSACNTAFADESNGREIDSLAEAIQTKSGKAVLATLWSVVDESTQLLMSEFYRLRKENPQLTKAAALQIAQQKMIAGKLTLSNAKNQRRDTSEVDIAPLDYSHPYFWSPFILIGNWR